MRGLCRRLAPMPALTPAPAPVLASAPAPALAPATMLFSPRNLNIPKVVKAIRDIETNKTETSQRSTIVRQAPLYYSKTAASE